MSKEFKKVLGLVLAAMLIYGTVSFASAASAPAKVKNVAVTTVDEDEINLKWSKVSGATGYQVYVRSGSSGSWKKAETTTKNYAEVENLKDAHVYSVRVRAYTKSGGKVLYGSYSSVLKATTDPEEPTNVTIGTTSNKKAKIKWSAVPGADGYRVTSKWVKDYKGWCYVDASGYMVYNQWVKDYKGWCYVDNSGYMVYNTVVDGYTIGADGYRQ